MNKLIETSIRVLLLLILGKTSSYFSFVENNLQYSGEIQTSFIKCGSVKQNRIGQINKYHESFIVFPKLSRFRLSLDGVSHVLNRSTKNPLNFRLSSNLSELHNV